MTLKDFERLLVSNQPTPNTFFNNKIVFTKNALSNSQPRGTYDEGKPRPAMYNSIFFLFMNALLNWVFVFGGPFRHMKWCGHWRGLGFIGAAVSLSCSRCLQPLFYWLYMFVWRKEHLEFWPGWKWRGDRRENTSIPFTPSTYTTPKLPCARPFSIPQRHCMGVM